jgi:hypothetical protein
MRSARCNSDADGCKFLPMAANSFQLLSPGRNLITASNHLAINLK